MPSEPMRIRWYLDGKEAAELDRIFEVTKGAAKRLPDLYARIVPLIREAIKSHFISESGPTGRWQKLSAEYSAWKEQNFPGQSLLQLRHRLINAATQKDAYGNITDITKNSLEYGVDLDKIPYARVHDMGGRAGRGARIPKREYMFLSKKDQDNISHESARFIWDEGLAGRPGGGIPISGAPWGSLTRIRGLMGF